jgi:hypothetical protein
MAHTPFSLREKDASGLSLPIKAMMDYPAKTEKRLTHSLAGINFL